MSGILPGHGPIIPAPSGVSEEVDLYPWVELDRADGSIVPIAGKVSGAAVQPSGFIRFTMDNPPPTPADYPSRMDAITWSLDYPLPDGETLSVLGPTGYMLMFRVEVDLATLPAGTANVAVLLGLCDQSGDASVGGAICLVGGFRYTGAGMILVASDRSIEVVSGANLEPTSDVATVQIGADARRLNQAIVSAESIAGGGAVATDVEALVYDFGSLVISCFVGADSIAGDGPHSIDVRLWAKAIPVLP